MTAVSARGITKRYGATTALDDAGLAIESGETHGLVGRNGAGKTTLFNVILGRLPPDDGEVSWPSSWKVGAVAQEAPGTDISLLDTVLEADTERPLLLAEA